LSDAKVTTSPWERVRASPFALRVVPSMRATLEWDTASVVRVRVREPAARTRGVIVRVELGE
jgi:hypothetical protein